jgi:hypothetical protein
MFPAYSLFAALACRCGCLSLLCLDVEPFSIDDRVRRISDNPLLSRQPGCNFGKIAEVTA